MFTTTILSGNCKMEVMTSVALSSIKNANNEEGINIVCFTGTNNDTLLLTREILNICNKLNIKALLQNRTVIINNSRIIIKNIQKMDSLRGLKVKHVKLLNVNLKTEVQEALDYFKISSLIYNGKELKYNPTFSIAETII